jgi:hypothetical protein
MWMQNQSSKGKRCIGKVREKPGTMVQLFYKPTISGVPEHCFILKAAVCNKIRALLLTREILSGLGTQGF